MNEEFIKEYAAPFNVELFDTCWESLDVTDDWFTALYLASSYCERTLEWRIRVIDNNNKII